MKTALLELIASKKFLAALTAIIVYLAGRFGFAIDTAVLDRIYAALLVYIGAQGIADAGKSAAKITAAAAPPPVTRSAAVGSAAMLALLAVGGAALLGGCGARQTTAGQIAWDCTAPQRAELVDVLTPVLQSVIAAAATGDGSKIDLGPIKEATSRANLASDAGQILTCAVASAFAALAHPSATRSSFAPTAPRPTPAAAQAAFDELRAASFPGATFKTASGTI